jgi:hypothetical protein
MSNAIGPAQGESARPKPREARECARSNSSETLSDRAKLVHNFRVDFEERPVGEDGSQESAIREIRIRGKPLLPNRSGATRASRIVHAVNCANPLAMDDSSHRSLRWEKPRL